jgi:hypothetical protein
MQVSVDSGIPEGSGAFPTRDIELCRNKAFGAQALVL